MSMQIISTGPLSLIQDSGRPGAASWGLGPGGALDRQALAAANGLVGNRASAAALEIRIGGFAAEFRQSGSIAVTGAQGEIMLDGVPVPGNTVQPVRSGSKLSIGPAAAGLRYYLAVSGGLLAEPVAGSRSRDVLAQLGPAPLTAGDLIEIGPAEETESRATSALLFRDPPTPGKPLALRVTPGPRLDWFVPSAWHDLGARVWTVSADSNRIGVRLSGRPLGFVRDGQLPSEGMVTGALQVPPSGQPTVFLADRPVTGGYPVIAVVRRADLDLLGQAAPGQQIRFLG
ncbi:MAG: biotin-dependent carboxyltransferase family protein [Renibacterium salmoninarum]|nr:biotin-dependent carboxyltransferase family protein [Renibacterium salmoninarum]